MEVGNVTSRAVPVVKQNHHSTSERQNHTAENVNSVSVTFERTEITANITFYTHDSSVTNAVNARQEADTEALDISEIAVLRKEIHEEILAQVKDFLGTFFRETPEAVEQISRGEIPEYFNVENTARRILNIYFSRFEEGQDRMEFVERAKKIIEQAYSDVGEMVGELPDIVQLTREKVMEILDIFASGGDISEFMQTNLI